MKPLEPFDKQAEQRKKSKLCPNVTCYPSSFFL